MPNKKRDILGDQMEKRKTVPDHVRIGSEERMAALDKPDKPIERMVERVRSGLEAYRSDDKDRHFYYEGDIVWALLSPDFKSGLAVSADVAVTGRELAAMIDMIIMDDEAIALEKIRAVFDRGLPFGVVDSTRKSDGIFVMSYGVAGLKPDREIDPVMMAMGVKNIFRELFFVKKYCLGMDIKAK